MADPPGSRANRFGGVNWPRISQCLDEALDLKGQARETWLAALRASEPAVADEVAALLVQHDAASASAFLATPINSPPDETNVPGRRIGAYALHDQVAQGGSGSVWRARRSDDTYEGEVAVKLLNLALAGTAGSANFRHEAGILARLRHPNIAYLFDAGITDDGQPYLVLELIEGETIDVYCDSRRLGVEQRIRLALDVLAAVAYAHAHLIVHRDVKPSNVMVTAQGQVKLLDFGIAKLIEKDAAGGAMAATTVVGSGAMTPAYAAPEQLQGQPTTTATDVYAFGVTLYQLLSGLHPNQAVTSNLAAFMRETLEVEPEKMSRRLAPHGRTSDDELQRIAAARGTTPAALRRRLEGDLDNIVARALHKLPEQRYESALALADDLRRHLELKPVSARPDSLGYRVGRFVRRHRVAVLAASTALVLLVASAVVSVWQMVAAQTEREEARAQAAKAEASRQFLQLMFAEIGAEGAALTVAELVERGAHLLDARFAPKSKTTVDQLIQLAGGYDFADQLDKQHATLLRAEAMAVALRDDERTAEARCNLAASEIRRDHRDQAQTWLTAAHAVLDRLDRASPALRADCLHADAVVAAAGGRLPEALARLRAGAALLESTGQTDHPSYSATLSRLSSLSLDAGDPKASFEHNRRNRLALEAMGRGGTKDMLVTMNNEAAALNGFGEVQRAEALQAELLRRAGARDPKARGLGTLLGNHASMLTTLARYADADAVLDDALARAQASGDALAQQRLNFQRARVTIRSGRLAEGERQLDRVEAEYRRDAKMNERWLRYVAATRAELLLRQGRVEPARVLMRELLAAIGYPKNSASIELVPALPVAVEIALAAGAVDEARALGDAAVAVAGRYARDPADSADVGKSWWQVARVRQAAGDGAGEREALGKALVALGRGLGSDHPITLAATQRARAVGLALAS
jgi:serine/threonine-protein kinase